MKGYADLVLLLVKHGTDVHAVNEYNHTALYYAAKHGYRRTADALISAYRTRTRAIFYSLQIIAALTPMEGICIYALGNLMGVGQTQLVCANPSILIDRSDFLLRDPMASISSLRAGLLITTKTFFRSARRQSQCRITAFHKGKPNEKGITAAPRSSSRTNTRRTSRRS